MKGWRAGLERASDWAQKYGWSIPVFAFGILFGLSVTVSLSIGSQWFETITALGTMAAAFAAFWSVYFSRRIQQRRDDLEDAVRKPYFQILLENTELFETPKQQPTYKFHFANMSKGFVLLRQAVIFDPQPHYWGPDYPDQPGPLVPDIPNLIIAPGEIKEKVINTIEIQKLGRTNLYFYFQHSVTGTVLYRLKLPVDIFLNDDTGQRVMSLSIYEQEIEGPVSQPFGVAGIRLTIPEVNWEQ